MRNLVISIVCITAFREKYAELSQTEVNWSDAKEVRKGCERRTTDGHVFSG